MSEMINPFGLTKTEVAIFEIGETSGWSMGVRAERERIIKLLESEKFILPEGIDEGLTLMPIQEAIALIKGEK